MRNGRYCTVDGPKNLTPLVPVLEVPNNDGGCLGYRLQLCLRRKLVILKSFMVLTGYWHQAQFNNNCCSKTGSNQRLCFTNRVCKMSMPRNDDGYEWKRDYMDDLLDCFVQLPKWWDKFLFPSSDQVFLVTVMSLTITMLSSPMMPCGRHWYSGDLSMVQAEWMAIHVTRTSTLVLPEVSDKPHLLLWVCNLLISAYPLNQALESQLGYWA